MRDRDADLRLPEEALTRRIDVDRFSFSIDNHDPVGHPRDHRLCATHFAINRLPQRLLDAPHRVAAQSHDDDAHDDHHQGQALAEAGDLLEIDILLPATLIGQRIGEIRSRSLQPRRFEHVFVRVAEASLSGQSDLFVGEAFDIGELLPDFRDDLCFLW